MTDVEQTCHPMAFTVPDSHPSLPGHFPGRPVVPGVVILDQVIAAAERSCGTHLRVTGLSAAKFVSPLLPGQPATIEFSRRGTAWTFSVASDGRAIARGTLVAEPASMP